MSLQQSLLGYIDRHRPFLPIDASTLQEDVREAFFDSRHELFSEYQTKPQIVIGRRGAGKTAFLESAHFTHKKDLVVSVDKGRALGQVCLVVDGIPQGGRYPEAIAELWDSIIYTNVLQQAVGKYGELKLGRDYLGKIGASPSATKDSIAWTLLGTLKDTQKSGTVGTIAELVRRLHSVSFHDAKEELFQELRRRDARVIVLIDSLDSEGYVFDDPDTLAALKGLLKWVGNTGAGRNPVHPRLAIPGEYYHDFLSISANPLKDFAKSSILRWTPRHLIVLSAVRFRRFLELTGHAEYEVWADADLTTAGSAVEMFRRVMPAVVHIPFGDAEDSFVYLLRHTQLLPRQFFFILNALFYSHQEFGPGATISEREVLDCVYETAPVIVNEIFGAHRHRHPNASTVCRRLLPYLQETFSYGELHKLSHRFKREYSDRDDLFDMLVDVGAIGKVVGMSGRYVLGQFQYNHDAPLVITSQDKLCVHPLFWAAFQGDAAKRQLSRVWPIGIGKRTPEED